MPPVLGHFRGIIEEDRVVFEYSQSLVCLFQNGQKLVSG